MTSDRRILEKEARRGWPHPAAWLCAAGLGVALIAGTSGAVAQTVSGAVSTFPGGSAEISVAQVRQMSVVVQAAGTVIYTDPTGGAERYAAHPPPDLILVSHEHAEHYDAATLQQLLQPETIIVVPPFVRDLLPESLAGRAVVLGNGQHVDLGEIGVSAVAAYGLRGPAQVWHPQGRGNGYVVTVDDRRLYFAGSTDAVPEMLALEDVFVAFLPLYPPYALGPDEAAAAVAAFRPASVYIYQYNSRATRDAFEQAMTHAAPETTVVLPEITR
ncbi:MBL fold metallo-hydrolase [Fertoebacter nigrum]|uniref:MBL fold metallo-hydrolase n=1 Tax=Fertoeibacter niger TaxID=2656921 RepID=A0A8X8GVA0_9RHOB|nr:MBL fold metallo-hydrolase [Fertoeibacter niger]NUB44988.1 MBL fold metallo-hydrolase [Fertoeibacter niger]